MNRAIESIRRWHAERSRRAQQRRASGVAISSIAGSEHTHLLRRPGSF